jgi:hypothetical protein
MCGHETWVILREEHKTGGVSEQGAQRVGPNKRKDNEKSYIMGSSIDHMLHGLLGLLTKQGEGMKGGWGDMQYKLRKNCSKTKVQY